MTSIEKTTIPISKAAVAIVFVGGLIVQYLTTINAVKEGMSDIRNEMKIEINNLKNGQENLIADLERVKLQNNDLKNAIFTYIGTGLKPEPPSIKTEREKIN